MSLNSAKIVFQVWEWQHGLVKTREMSFEIEVERQSKYLLWFSLFILDFWVSQEFSIIASSCFGF